LIGNVGYKYLKIVYYGLKLNDRADSETDKVNNDNSDKKNDIAMDMLDTFELVSKAI
jgi:hypothetical protein